MKFYLLIVCLFCSNLLLKGQGQQIRFVHYSPAYIPDSVTRDPVSFAAWIQLNFRTEDQRLMVVYRWITNTIQYNNDSSYYYTFNGSLEEKVTAILRRRKGVCEQFATLLSNLCNRVGINAYTVHGYADGGGNSQNVAHAWCAIQTGREWKLFDPTWDAVPNNGDYRYYAVGPASFIQTHMPFDPMWQLLEQPIGFRRSAGEKFSYCDTIQTFFAADSLEQFLSIDRRMQRMVSKKELFKIWQSYNKMNIAIMAGEEDMRLYNGAVEDLNQATELLNQFIQYRNNRFLPSRPEKDVIAMLQPVEKYMQQAQQKITALGKVSENFQYDPGTIKVKLDALARRTNEQLAFVKKYFSLAVTEREPIFYK